MGSLVGGWQLSGIAHWQTGLPFSVSNGTDRNGDGQVLPDRADISNGSAPLNTRAVIKTSCATGYGNPDVTGIPCIDPTTVHFIEGTGLPNGNTVGRNTLLLPDLSNLDFAAAKKFRFTERMNLEFRVDMLNAFNQVQLGYRTPVRTVAGTLAGTFLNFNQTDSVGRTMRMRLKFSF